MSQWWLRKFYYSIRQLDHASIRPSKSTITCLIHQIQGVERVSDQNKKAMRLCQITKIALICFDVGRPNHIHS